MGIFLILPSTKDQNGKARHGPPCSNFSNTSNRFRRLLDDLEGVKQHKFRIVWNATFMFLDIYDEFLDIFGKFTQNEVR